MAMSIIQMHVIVSLQDLNLLIADRLTGWLIHGQPKLNGHHYDHRNH